MSKVNRVMVLDLELNQPTREIIQVGAVWGDVITGEVIDTFCSHVYTPNEITPYITALTGITQENVDTAPLLHVVYKELVKKHGQLNAFMNPVTWGGDDAHLLREQCPSESWVFGRRHIDAKTLFVSWRIANNKDIQGGLAKSMSHFGLRFNGQKHNAKDDALNTFSIYCEMLKLLRGK